MILRSMTVTDRWDPIELGAEEYLFFAEITTILKVVCKGTKRTHSLIHRNKNEKNGSIAAMLGNSALSPYIGRQFTAAQ